MLEGGEIGQQLPIDAGLPIDGGRLAPELACLHCEPASERVEFTERRVDVAESPKPVLGGVPCLQGAAETIVEVDPVWTDHPEQRREALVPYLPPPGANKLISRTRGLELKIDRES